MLSYDPEAQLRLKRKERKTIEKMKQRQSKILSFSEIKSRRDIVNVSYILLVFRTRAQLILVNLRIMI